jgi:outer membrane protein assembly factor BamB
MVPPGAVAPSALNVPVHAAISGFPVLLDADHEYVAFASADGKPGGVVAFDRAGKEVWRHATKFQPSAPLGLGGDPFHPKVLVPDKDGHVYALDPATGEEAWSVEGFGEFTTQPATVGGQIYVGNADGHFSRIDTDGGVVWSVALGAPVTGAPAFAAGKIFVGLGNGRLVALSENP